MGNNCSTKVEYINVCVNATYHMLTIRLASQDEDFDSDMGEDPGMDEERLGNARRVNATHRMRHNTCIRM